MMASHTHFNAFINNYLRIQIIVIIKIATLWQEGIFSSLFEIVAACLICAGSAQGKQIPEAGLIFFFS